MADMSFSRRCAAECRPTPTTRPSDARPESQSTRAARSTRAPRGDFDESRLHRLIHIHPASILRREFVHRSIGDDAKPPLGDRLSESAHRSRSDPMGSAVVREYMNYRYKRSFSMNMVAIESKLFDDSDSRMTRAGERAPRAISRGTNPHARNDVRHYPSLRASRQDRRRLHRQGVQRQVHDGLAPARQQVRLDARTIAMHEASRTPYLCGAMVG